MALSITFAVNGQTVRQIDNVPWQTGMNGQDAMEHAYGSAGYSFLLQYFGPQLGYEVVSIDGIANQTGSDAVLFWELSVNGKTADKGIDQMALNDGDKVSWNFKRYEEGTHGAGRYAAIQARSAPRPQA